jgi:hypothetical protein
MRRGLDEWATYVAILLMTIRLEDRLGFRLTDDEVDGVKTLRDLAAIVASRMENRSEATSSSVELTTSAAGELARDPFWAGRPSRPSATANPLDFDVPLLDALEPDRWKNRPAVLRLCNGFARACRSAVLAHMIVTVPPKEKVARSESRAPGIQRRH